jgi:hypothetical protein
MEKLGNECRGLEEWGKWRRRSSWLWEEGKHVEVGEKRGVRIAVAMEME